MKYRGTLSLTLMADIMYNDTLTYTANDKLTKHLAQTLTPRHSPSPASRSNVSDIGISTITVTATDSCNGQ